MRHLAEYLKRRGITNSRILQAFDNVPRHLFVEEDMQEYAYEDMSLPIRCQQTISQPFVVALMTEALLTDHEVHKVLEVGTGSGYQAAILAELVDEVYSIERIRTLHETAQKRLQELGYNNIFFQHGDGYAGWTEHAPFDGIIVTAASSIIPPLLLQQLSPCGGRLVIPVGSPAEMQTLLVVTRQDNEYLQKELDAVIFVPMLPNVSDQ